MSSDRKYFEIANPEIPNIIQNMPRGLRVLDVGCGSGVHGAELARIYGHRVVGVDLSAASIEKAQNRIAEAYVADVTCPERYPFYGKQQFDLIVFSDILEHLLDPSDVLERHVKLLGAGGKVVISLPNVAIWNVRLALLAGHFDYTDTGTLDRTHMRFFTRKTFQRFARGSGLAIVRSRITPGIVRPFVPLIKKMYGGAGAAPEESDSSSIMDSGPYRLYMRWLYPIERAICSLWPGLLAFQFVTLSEPVQSIDHASPSGSGLSELQRELERQRELASR